MAMPNEIIFARHGQSEANIVQKYDNHGVDPEVASQIFARPDWMNRLSNEGVMQAERAKLWIDANLGGVASFDALYVSPFMRTRETAAHMGGPDVEGWTIDDRIVERSWGVYGKLSRALQQERFPLTAEEKRLNPWYTRLDGGESMPDVYGRFRDFQGTLHREQEGKRVFVVTHGDFMNVARYGIERMTPEEWEDLDNDSEYRITNCMLLHYSRVNPSTGEVDPKMRWRRYINPLDPDASPDGGRWVELGARRRYTGAELIRQAERAPRLMKED
jgi:broad specificity phosphatase PhoE